MVDLKRPGSARRHYCNGREPGDLVLRLINRVDHVSRIARRWFFAAVALGLLAWVFGAALAWRLLA